MRSTLKLFVRDWAVEVNFYSKRVQLKGINAINL